jgi:hypothetical protein
MNRRLLLLALAAVAAVSLAGGAGAGTTIQLKIGDAVDVLHTHVACYALNSNGKDGIGCVLISDGKPIPGTYSVGLAVDGTAVLNKINTDGSATHVFKKRLPASRSSSTGTVYRVKPGQSFGLPVSGDVVIGCKVSNTTSGASIYRGIKVTCWYADATHAIPNRYGVAISDRLAGVFRVTPSGQSTTLMLKNQPSG